MRFLALWTSFLITRAHAQIFDGPGLEAGVTTAGEIEGPVKTTLREFILDMLHKALGFLALSAMVMIVIAGFMFILSSGDDTIKDRAKKIIIYVAIGLVVILLARAVVSFFMAGLP